jgi:hypothetical protein
MGVVFQGGRHESIEEDAQFEKVIHWKPRIRYDLHRARFCRAHPLRQKKRRTIRLADDEMMYTSELLAAGRNNRLSGQWVKRISDGNLKCQTLGIMNSLLKTERLRGQPCRR